MRALFKSLFGIEIYYLDGYTDHGYVPCRYRAIFRNGKLIYCKMTRM